MSFATIYVTQENFNSMKVHLRMPTFDRIFLLHGLLSVNFYWDQVGFETRQSKKAKKFYLIIRTLSLIPLFN